MAAGPRVGAAQMSAQGAAAAWDDRPSEDGHRDAWDARRGQPPPWTALSGALEAERGRFFLWAPVFFGAGIAAYFGLPREPTVLFAFVPLVAALVLFAVTARGSLARAAVMALALSGCGFAIAKLRVEAVRAPVLERPLRNVEIAGVVTRIEPRSPRGARVTIDIATLGELKAEQRPKAVRVRILRDVPGLKTGDRIRLKATLAPPAKPAIPGGFDFARTAWFEHLGGVGYTFSPPEIEAAAVPVPISQTSARVIEELRLTIGQRIKAALPGEQGAIATALITGERGGISAETNGAFKNSGLFHILSISGLHMVIMAGAVFFSLRLLLACIPAVALRYPIKKWAAAAGIVAAFFYLAISGAAFATVRSALMIAVAFGAVLVDRPALALRNVALSAFLILAVYPESLFDAGFQMSFAAVTGLVATYEEVRRRTLRWDGPHPVWRILLFFGGIVFSTLVASAAVAPFGAYHFHQSQQYAVLANLLAIPVCNIVVMPAALAALVLMPFGLEALALVPMGLGIDAMSWCARTVAAIPGAVGHLPAMPVHAFALMVGGGLWLALWQTRWRLLGISAALCGVVLAPFLARPDVLVARNGELVALRGADGLLSALPARQSKFELGRWLEHDGDGRSSSEAQKAGGFSCDGAGCVAQIKSITLSVALHPAALADDCARAEILVLNVPQPQGCDGTDAATVIDVFDMWREGTHAIYIDAAVPAGAGMPRVRVDTVAAHRGDRPWAKVPEDKPERSLRTPRVAPSGATDAGQLPAFAARPELLGAEPPRAEIEDDDGGTEAPPDPLAGDSAQSLSPAQSPAQSSDAEPPPGDADQ